MKLNKKKTKVMIFNTAKTRDFTPQLEVEGYTLEVVEEIKLLGVQITSDLKWTSNSNTAYVTKRGYMKRNRARVQIGGQCLLLQISLRMKMLSFQKIKNKSPYK